MSNAGRCHYLIIMRGDVTREKARWEMSCGEAPLHLLQLINSDLKTKQSSIINLIYTKQLVLLGRGKYIASGYILAYYSQR
jgi:hypothetical protein